VYTRAGGTFALLYIVLIALLTAAARNRVPGATPLQSPVINAALRSFTLRSTALALPLFMLAGAAGGLLGPMSVPLFKNQLGYSDAEIGTLNGLISNVASVGGALAGGILSDRIGRRRAIVIFVLLTSGIYLAVGSLAPLWTSRTFLYSYVVTIAVAEGMLQATFLSLAMDLSNPAVGGTQFTAYMSAQNVKNTWTSWLGGMAAASLGAPLMFAVAAAAQAAVLLLLPFVNPEEAKRAFRKEGGGEPRAGAPEAGASA
jgi:PAT family beta-lactamase induction signal transducer AmpG